MVLQRDGVRTLVQLVALAVVCSRILTACGQDRESPEPADRMACSSARALLQRLHDQAGCGVLFGHQDTIAYGVGWTGDGHTSDIRDVCGRWPVVYGWDLGDIHRARNLDGVSFRDMKRWMIAADARGGINTISMHLDNPVTGRNAWDKSKAVSAVLPGGEKHRPFLTTLDQIGAFLSELKRADGSPVPVILRPFHEANKDWAWWGRDGCSDEQFVSLWNMTVRHLQEHCVVHNVLYAWSPQDVVSEKEYLNRYPGDATVDVFGLDYYKVWHWRQVPQFGESLSMVNRLAAARGKVAALTETGVDKVPNADWWTEYLLKGLKHDEWSRRTVWVLVWRNKSRGHHFGPFPGHPSEADFLQFHADPVTVFAAEE